jgi:hypothetical protein
MDSLFFNNPLVADVYNRFPPVLELSAIASFDNEANNYSIENAEVILYENDGPVDTLRWVNNINTNGDFLTGIYIGDTTNLIDGASYHLKVNAPGYVTATTETLVFEQYFDDDFTEFSVTTICLETDEVEIEAVLQFRVVKVPDDGFFTVTELPNRVINQTNAGGGIRQTWRILLPKPGSTLLPTPMINDLVLFRGFDSTVDLRILEVNLNNRNLYASYITNNTAEILSSYLNMEDEDIGGIFNQPQLLVVVDQNTT